MSGRDECWCEHVDIGVGMIKVAESPECPVCFPDLLPELECWCEYASPAGIQRFETPGCPAHDPDNEEGATK